jgi:hypothetical protein
MIYQRTAGISVIVNLPYALILQIYAILFGLK